MLSKTFKNVWTLCPRNRDSHAAPKGLARRIFILLAVSESNFDFLCWRV